MPATIKRLTGNGTVAITTKTPVAFTDYGNLPAGGDETFDALAARTNVLTDSTGGTVTAIITQPAQGHARARSDGKLELCLVRESPTFAGDLTVVYTRTGGSSPGTVTATITVAATPTYFGWAPDYGDAFYTPEEDADNVIVVERRTSATRYLYTSANGVSRAEIQSRHSLGTIGNVSGSFLHSTVALGTGSDGTSKWGETQALAVTDEVANLLIAYWRGSVKTQEYQQLYERGGAYSATASNDHSLINGYSALFPNLVDSYGTGAYPIFRGDGAAVPVIGLTYNLVFQRLSYEDDMQLVGVRRMVLNKLRFDGIYNTGYSISMEGKANYSHGLHVRYIYFINSYKRTPLVPGTWGAGNSDRRSAAYFNAILGLKLEHVFSSESGWARGYRGDRSTDFPQSPTDRSHGIYFSGANVGVALEDMIVGWPSQTYMQGRDGAYVARFFGWGSNGALFIGASSGGVDANPIDHRAFSCVSDYWATRSGQKDIYRPGANVAAWSLSGALTDNGEMNSWRRCIAAHSTLAPAFTSGTELGPRRTGSANGTDDPYSPGTNPYVMDFMCRNWLLAEYEQGLEGLDAGELADLDAATIENWLQDRIGGTPKTITDVDNYLRSLDDPTEELPSILEWIQTPAGKYITPRSTGGDVHFLPPADGATPGHRGDLAENWDGMRRPGTFTGDSLFWDGARASSNFNAINPLVNYSFGSGAYIRMFGGKHESTGTLSVGTAGATLVQSLGSKFLFAGYTGSNQWTVDVTEARWHNKGTVSGPVSLAAHYRSQVILAEGGQSYTIALDQALAVYATAQVGWYDDGGGTATLTNNGSVRFFTSCQMNIDGITQGAGDSTVRYGNILPKVGATITFSGGGSARIAAIIELSQSAVTLILEDLAGPKPADNETITGETFAGADPTGTFAFASVNGTPIVTMATIEEFRPSVSHHGAVNVNSVFAAASGVISPRVAWLSDGTYTLVTADDVTAVAPAIGENASGLASGKACRVTVNTSTNTVTMLLGNEGAAGLPASGFDLVVV
jgi:hypothetical protein